ncbi:ATP-binding protein [Actinocrispum sp. NPDC049592]|uniref:ATP-binding protein n=1 Tax=Actinocrispum sp. NPDC049592 TaxID=3154835 RepID=UPI00341D712F
MTPSPEVGDDSPMPDDPNSVLPAPALRDWASSLPSFAAEVVSQTDTSRPHIYTRMPAMAEHVGLIRAQLTGWAGRLGLTAVQRQDVVLAVDEAASNAVEHAYPSTPGTVTIFAAHTRSGDAVRVIVSDEGLWRPPPADPGFRGRGLAMMELVAEVFRLMSGPGGTTVVLGWSLPA